MSNEPKLTVRRPEGDPATTDVEALLRNGLIDLAITVEEAPRLGEVPTPGRIRLMYVDRLPRSMEAYRYVVERLDALNMDYLRAVARTAGRPTS